ncbi:hypothetical protein RJ639_026747 [Escallonia herrerae]|uniref:Protein LAZ1 homolog 2 n=1 Tax=Escallonia herrerae TaxID=1293975 RepID=A0AA88X5V1_9ASTE|nr:hypothetical protein RJ639_026747 [Escallonia herrerae]
MSSSRYKLNVLIELVRNTEVDSLFDRTISSVTLYVIMALSESETQNLIEHPFAIASPEGQVNYTLRFPCALTTFTNMHGTLQIVIIGAVEPRLFAVENAGDMASYFILNDQNAYTDLRQPAIIVSGCFVCVALVLSTLLIFQHLRSYTNPEEQKWIVAVLFMVPVYAIESTRAEVVLSITKVVAFLFPQILSLVNPRLSLACDILRNCYEAFALYSFGSYLIACLGGERKVIDLLEDESRKLLSKPLLEGTDKRPDLPKRTLWNFFRRPCVLGKDLLTIEKFGLVQYMILKTVCAFLALVLELFGVYGDGEFKWYYGYPYLAVVLNFSQMWALYCLVQFYNVTHERLKHIKPLAKFISFKAIVFATWWQGVGIALSCTLGVLPKAGKFQTGLQDFLICIEMAIAAVAHVYVFSATPYHFLPASEYGKVATETTKAMLKIEEGDKEKPAVYEKKETEVESPGTSIKESVQDIVVEGGQHVVKDVVLTINQAIEPVEKGMTKIQERFHEMSVSSDDKKEKQEVQVEEYEQQLTRDRSRVFKSRDKLVTQSSNSSCGVEREKNDECHR